jgi:adenylate cyclase
MADRDRDPGEALLYRADLAAERWTGIARMSAAAILLILIFIIAQDLPADSTAIIKQIRLARVTLLLFFAVGLIGFLVARRGTYWPSFAYVTTTADAALISSNLWLTLDLTELSGNFFSITPVIWVIPIALAANVLRFRPRLQLFTAVLYVAAIISVVVAAGYVDLAERNQQLAGAGLFFGWPPNTVRITMIGLGALILVGVAAWGRGILLRAVTETERRVALGRYLPAELAPVLAAGRIDALKIGQRNPVALLFVDIRNSTAMEESLSPTALSTFIGAFRQRVMQAAMMHGGVIDKFVGDGAFLVFGIVDPKRDDAARAVRCGQDILASVAQWSAERVMAGEPPVSVGVGIHFGEAFVGAIGDNARLEFTVLGDAVNVANRLEQATKDHRVPMLVSHEALAAGGADLTQWRALGSERLRGRAQPIGIYTPAVSGVGGRSDGKRAAIAKQA